LIKLEINGNQFSKSEWKKIEKALKNKGKAQVLGTMSQNEESCSDSEKIDLFIY